MFAEPEFEVWRQSLEASWVSILTFFSLFWANPMAVLRPYLGWIERPVAYVRKWWLNPLFAPAITENDLTTLIALLFNIKKDPDPNRLKALLQRLKRQPIVVDDFTMEPVDSWLGMLILRAYGLHLMTPRLQRSFAVLEDWLAKDCPADRLELALLATERILRSCLSSTKLDELKAELREGKIPQEPLYNFVLSLVGSNYTSFDAGAFDFLSLFPLSEVERRALETIRGLKSRKEVIRACRQLCHS